LLGIVLPTYERVWFEFVQVPIPEAVCKPKSNIRFWFAIGLFYFLFNGILLLLLFAECNDGEEAVLLSFCS